MKLLVVLLCLLSERFLLHAISYKRFSWFDDYYLFINEFIKKKNLSPNPWVIISAIVLLIIIPVAVIFYVFHFIIFGFLSFILSIVVFLYCLGPQNAFYPVTQDSEAALPNTQAARYFAQVNGQLFAVIFWYVIAGPIALLTYRLITLCRNISTLSQEAIQLTDIIEWIPARITTLFFLLVGNFQRGFTHFVAMFLSKPECNSQILSECGLLAVRNNESDEVTLFVAEDLVEHALVVFLVLIALFTLVAWL